MSRRWCLRCGMLDIDRPPVHLLSVPPLDGLRPCHREISRSTGDQVLFFGLSFAGNLVNMIYYAAAVSNGDPEDAHGGPGLGSADFELLGPLAVAVQSVSVRRRLQLAVPGPRLRRPPLRPISAVWMM